MIRFAMLISFFLLLQSCSTNPPNFHNIVESSSSAKMMTGRSLGFNCAHFYSQFDRLVEAENVRDVQASLLKSYPYLSINRFLASFADDLRADLKAEFYSFEKIDYWLLLLAEINLEARQIEWLNLSRMSQEKFSNQFMFNNNFKQKLEACSKVLLAELSEDAKFLLLGSVSVTDDYSVLQRFFGAYWISSLAVSFQIKKRQLQAYKTFESGYEKLMIKGKLLRYELPQQLNSERNILEKKPLDIADSTVINDNNPLSIPKINDLRLLELFARHAPILEVDEEDINDVVGTIVLNQNGFPVFSADHATVYILPSYTRFNGENLLQLNYVFWFSSRPAEHWFDIYSGKLDGLTWRVTLDKQGNPLVYDSVHNCGCYHKFYLTDRVSFNETIASQEDEPPFVVKQIEGILSKSQGGRSNLPSFTLPTLAFGEDTIEGRKDDSAIVIRIGSAAHFVNAVYYSQRDKKISSTQSRGKKPIRTQKKSMQMLPYRTLRSLANRNTNGRQSMFMSNGLVEGTARAERWLLWPMGVSSAGAMRQWGHHAIAFVGKRYFDDANLLDRYFSPK